MIVPLRCDCVRQATGTPLLHSEWKAEATPAVIQCHCLLGASKRTEHRAGERVLRPSCPSSKQLVSQQGLLAGLSLLAHTTEHARCATASVTSIRHGGGVLLLVLSLSERLGCQLLCVGSGCNQSVCLSNLAAVDHSPSTAGTVQSLRVSPSWWLFLAVMDVIYATQRCSALANIDKDLWGEMELRLSCRSNGLQLSSESQCWTAECRAMALCCFGVAIRPSSSLCNPLSSLHCWHCTTVLSGHQVTARTAQTE